MRNELATKLPFSEAGLAVMVIFNVPMMSRSRLAILSVSEMGSRPLRSEDM